LRASSHTRTLWAAFVVAFVCVIGGCASEIQAADKAHKAKPLREIVYEKLTRAQEATEVEDWEKAFKELEKVKKMKDLAPHEKAQLYTTYGYTYFAQENYVESAVSYEQVLIQDELSEVMRTTTLFTLGQLYFHLGEFEKAAGHLESWLEIAENPGPQPYVLLGQAYYQLDRLDEAAEPVRKAIAVAEKRGKKVRENWYALLRVIYFETKDYDNLLDVLEILVTRYPAKEYWIHLSSAFGEMGDAKRQLAAYEMAYTQGYLKSSTEIVLLCQLLLQAEVPYRAGVLLQDGLDSGAITSNAGNWRLLSQAWILAQENDAAVASLKKAAALSDDGELFARIAQTYVNMNEWELAVEAAGTALDRGVKNPHDLHLLQGMAYFELGKYSDAQTAFSKAQKVEQSRETASRWLAYVQREEKRVRELGIKP
jgi:tetratricopeptide (TPR) repeat protein